MCFRANFELTKKIVILGIFAEFMAPRIFYPLRVLTGGPGGDPKIDFLFSKIVKNAPFNLKIGINMYLGYNLS